MTKTYAKNYITAIVNSHDERVLDWNWDDWKELGVVGLITRSKRNHIAYAQAYYLYNDKLHYLPDSIKSLPY